MPVAIPCTIPLAANGLDVSVPEVWAATLGAQAATADKAISALAIHTLRYHPSSIGSDSVPHAIFLQCASIRDQKEAAVRRAGLPGVPLARKLFLECAGLPPLQRGFLATLLASNFASPVRARQRTRLEMMTLSP
jgi:hypothetical protein